jgi:hypothetical protein
MTPTLLINNVYAVEVPEGATQPYFDRRQSIGFTLNGELRFVHLPEPGSWQLMGMVREVTRSNAAELCEWFELAGKKGYRDYSFTDDLRYPFLDPISSWRSLLKAKTLDTNKNWVLVRKG